MRPLRKHLSSQRTVESNADVELIKPDLKIA